MSDTNPIGHSRKMTYANVSLRFAPAWRVSLGWLAMLLCCAGLALGPQAYAAEPSASEGPPLVPLGPGDSVSLKVFGQPDMDGTLFVAADGTLNVPLVGPVDVAGRSAIDAAKRIEAALVSGGFLKNPHVTVALTQSRSQRVTVLGEVHTPGRYVVDGGTTILDLLAQAGGTNESAGDVIYVLHPQPDGTVSRRTINLQSVTQSLSVGADYLIQSGESVFVPKAETFYVYGAVVTPNAYRLEPGMTVRQGIARAGGITPRGSDSRLEIERKDASGKTHMVSVKLTDLLQAGDVLKVRESLF